MDRRQDPRPGRPRQPAGGALRAIRRSARGPAAVVSPATPALPSRLARAVLRRRSRVALALSVGRPLRRLRDSDPWPSPFRRPLPPPRSCRSTATALYDVLPARARVHITLDATITNTHRDTGTARTYFDTAYLAVLPGTANFRGVVARRDRRRSRSASRRTRTRSSRSSSGDGCTRASRTPLRAPVRPARPRRDGDP